MLYRAHAAAATVVASAAPRIAGKAAASVTANYPGRNRPCFNSSLATVRRPSCRRALVSPSVASSSEMQFAVAGRRNSSSSTSTSPIGFAAPPDELEDGYFERPTPVLLVAGEGQAPSWWDSTASFLAARGCTVGTMALTGRGSSSTDTLTLRALQSGVAAAVENSGLTPPVIVAHSMAGFVCQQYLQSYSASGLVLLDSFPPCPRLLAQEHLQRALASDPHRHDERGKMPPGLDPEELARLMKDDPAQWESLLRRYFAEFHQLSPWQDATPPRRQDQSGRSTPFFSGQELAGGDRSSLQTASDDIRFPVKAFAQMCLDERSSTLRLESHVVETLVLGSMGSGDPNSGGSLTDGGGKSGVVSGGRDALDVAKLDSIRAICEFHGTDGWTMVDREGLVVDGDVHTGSGGNGGEGSAEQWREVLWNWYDARF